MTHEILLDGAPWKAPEASAMARCGFGRAHWMNLIAAEDPQALAVCVLERLQSPSIDKLLTIQPRNQQMIERYLRRLALTWLGKEPLREREVDEVRGHPTRLAERAFERPGYVGVAAALYAINHDQLLPFRNDQLEGDLRELRLAFARTLFELDPKRRAWTLDLVERMRPGVGALAGKAEGNAEATAQVDAWLANHRTRLAALTLVESEAADDMVVDQPDGLHEGVADRRSDE